MTILECQDLAKEIGFNSAEFYICDNKGKIKCKWLDAYYGLFTIEEKEGFAMVKDFSYEDSMHLVWCEDLQPAEPRWE